MSTYDRKSKRFENRLIQDYPRFKYHFLWYLNRFLENLFLITILKILLFYNLLSYILSGKLLALNEIFQKALLVKHFFFLIFLILIFSTIKNPCIYDGKAYFKRVYIEKNGSDVFIVLSLLFFDILQPRGHTSYHFLFFILFFFLFILMHFPTFILVFLNVR